MDSTVRALFEKSSDPAHAFVVRLDDIVREIIDEEICHPPDRLERFSKELEKIGEELSRRDMLHDALCAVNLRDRRKKAGVKRDSDRFAPFERLSIYVHREGAMFENKSEDERALEQGLSFLKRHDKTVCPDLQKHLDVYGLRAGKLYREGEKAAWIPFSWEYSVRNDNKVKTLKIDHVSGKHEVLCCHPFLLKKLENGDEFSATKAMLESSTDYFREDIRSYRPLSCQDGFRKVLRAFYKTENLVIDHGLRENGLPLREDLKFVGFFVSTNKNRKISSASFERENGKIISYKYTKYVSEMLFRKAVEILKDQEDREGRPAKRTRDL